MLGICKTKRQRAKQIVGIVALVIATSSYFWVYDNYYYLSDFGTASFWTIGTVAHTIIGGIFTSTGVIQKKHLSSKFKISKENEFNAH